MLITINSDYRDADEAYCFYKLLLNLDFNCLERDLCVYKMHFDNLNKSLSDDDLNEIFQFIKDWEISCDINFKV